MTSEIVNQEEPAELVGTVKLYNRHLVVCTGVTGWVARIENDGAYLQQLAQAVANVADRTAGKVKITACDEKSFGDQSDAQSGFDILVFPDGLRYENVRPSEFAALIEDHLVGNRPSDRLSYIRFNESYVFVCSHGERDDRCGQCGPPLVARFEAELKRRKILEKIFVRKVSHVGGHAYAGNVLIYPGGHWYGYVSPSDVPLLIDTHLVQHQIVKRLWRGRMDLSPEEQIAQYEAGKLDF